MKHVKSSLRTQLTDQHLHDLHISTSPFEPGLDEESSQCSGRSLVTLVVAWVGAAMVASVLLRWKYMWIALAVLTLFFLIATGYAACTSRRCIQGQSIREHTTNCSQQRTNIRSVCGDMEHFPDNCICAIIEPPAYQAYWITDLPPPYAVVIDTAEQTTASITTSTDNIQFQTFEPRLSNPPPYSTIIQSADTPIHSATIPQTIQDHHYHHHYHHHHHDYGVVIPTNMPSISRQQLVPHVSSVSSQEDIKI